MLVSCVVVVCCVLWLCVVLLLCCVVVLLRCCCGVVALLFHSHFNACDATTKLAPDAPSPRRTLTQKTAQELYTPIQTQSPPRVSLSSMNSAPNFMRRPPYPNSAAKCCWVHQVLLKQPLHAQLNSITSFTIADVTCLLDHAPRCLLLHTSAQCHCVFSTLSSLLVNTCFTLDTRQTDSFVSLTNCSWEPAHRPHPCNQLSQPTACGKTTRDTMP